jgi:hypothetical protein
MPSPFPGMNPYLEQETVWHDFHERFCPAAAEFLTAQIRPHFIAKIDEHVYIHERPEDPRRFLGRGDVTVARPHPHVGTASAATLEAPTRVQLPAVDIERLSFLEIRDRQTWRIVTIIELLSPSNKQSGPDREQYVAKRSELLRSAVHFVELDLLRGGPRMPMEDLPQCDYYALVGRIEERPGAGLWPFGLRDPLPVIPIPLVAPHPDARLDLKQVLDRIYDVTGYEDYIYGGEPRPPLDREDASWARDWMP